MSIVKKYSRTVMGLSALGFASVTQIAHADSQVESYPEELDKLITEAKSLGIAVAEEPTKTVTSDDDLKTHYDKLTTQLRELIASYKSAKADNDKATAAYEKAEAEYQKALSAYEEAKKSYNEQVIEYEKQSKVYEDNQKAVQSAKEAYEKSLEKWNQSVQNDKDALVKYQTDLAAYNQALKDNAAAEQAYQNAKRQYELDKFKQSEIESAYNIKKAEYDKVMTAYNEKKAKYDADMIKYQADMSKYEADVKAYDKAKIDYENRLKQYQADVEALKEFDKKTAEYQKKYQQYETELAKYNAAKAEYDKQLAEIKANKGKDGWLKEAVSQNLIYKSEPNAVAKVSTSKNAQPISANGIKRAFEAIQLKAYYIDALVADSRSYKIAIDSTTTAPEKVSKIKGEGGLGGPDNKEFIAYRVGRDSSVTIDYTNLTNSTYAGKPLSKVSMTLDVDPSSINISEYGVLAFAQNPQHGFNINFRRNDQANGHYALKFKVTMKFYDADGKLIDLKSDAYLGLSSLNSTVGPGTVEGFTLGNGTQEVGITGSSIQKQGDKYYSTVPNNTSNVFGQANIDSPSNPYFWYMGSALRLTGTAPSFNIFSGDPEYVGRKRIDSYIPGLWMTVTSNIAAKTAINPGQPPVEPKKPVSPAASEPVEPTAPKAPKAPVKPIEPEKPTVTEPPKPDLTPVAPPTPPTPKLVQKPNEPVDTAGEKPKEPKVPRVEKPKEPTDNAGTPPVKPVKPTPVSPVKASINVNKVTIERITNWVTTDGKVLKNPVIDKDFKPKDNFEGYEFVETKVEGNKTTHIYQPIQKQTRWITTDGKVLKNPVIDKDFKPKDNFEGYEFVETKVEGNTTTHIYQPIPKKTVTTIWVTEDGQVLRPRENGEQPKDNFDGYEYVRTDKDKDGNIRHIYKSVPKKIVTTIWVTEDGQVLRPRENGEQPKDNFDGYTYVRTEKDKDGNIRHIYKPVPKQPKEAPKAKELPKTGDASAIASIIGLGLTALGVTTLSRRKR